MADASSGTMSIEDSADVNKLPGTAPTDKRYPQTNQIKTCYMCALAGPPCATHPPKIVRGKHMVWLCLNQVL